MLIIALLEMALIVFLTLVFGSQILIPMLENRKMFPMFRKQGKIEVDIVEENQKSVERELETKLKNMKKENEL